MMAKVGDIITIDEIYKSSKPPYWEIIEGKPPKGRELKKWEIIEIAENSDKTIRPINTHPF